ncbi:MAG: NAD(P)/FAD-dependent oxidoreductase, partial [Clostridia bacterium]|nr:NAD(P)/FAD-dependent oxidoreductase [Clostridia bacterium]
ALEMPEKAKTILTTYWGYLGVPTDVLNCVHFLSMLTSYMDNGAAMPYMRSHELSLALCDIIYKNGGEIRYNSEVTEFIYNEDGTVAGVVAGGEKLYAKEIISNVIADNVFARSKGANLPERDVKLANAREFGISVATIYLGLDATAEEIGIKDYTVFVANDADPRLQNDNRMEGGFYIVNCLNQVIPDASPKGTSMMFFTMPVYGSDVPKDLKPQDYKKYKNDLAEKYIRDYEKVMGINIIDHIEEIAIATPVTFARYLGTPEGTIYGYKSSGWDNVVMRSTAQVKDNGIKNLSFVGGHGIMGDGYSCAYMTGEAAAKKVIKKLKGGK